MKTSKLISLGEKMVAGAALLVLAILLAGSLERGVQTARQSWSMHRDSPAAAVACLVE